VYRLDRVDGSSRLPFSLKVLLENLLPNEDGARVTAEQIAVLASWDDRQLRGPAAARILGYLRAKAAEASRYWPPARVILLLL